VYFVIGSVVFICVFGVDVIICEVLVKEMKEIEYVVDEFIYEIMWWVNFLFIMLFDCEDIYLFVLNFDDCMGYMEFVVDWIMFYCIGSLLDGVVS